MKANIQTVSFTLNPNRDGDARLQAILDSKRHDLAQGEGNPTTQQVMIALLYELEQRRNHDEGYIDEFSPATAGVVNMMLDLKLRQFADYLDERLAKLSVAPVHHNYAIPDKEMDDYTQTVGADMFDNLGWG